MKDETDEIWENMADDPGIYISLHKKNSRGVSQICKLSDLKRLSLPRRAALEWKRDELCKVISTIWDKQEKISLSDYVGIIFDTIAAVDEETVQEENSMLLILGDW